MTCIENKEYIENCNFVYRYSLSKINNQLIIDPCANMNYFTIIIKSLTIIIKVRGTFANNQCEVSAKLFLLGLKSYTWKIAESVKNQIKQQSC